MASVLSASNSPIVPSFPVEDPLNSELGKVDVHVLESLKDSKKRAPSAITVH